MVHSFPYSSFHPRLQEMLPTICSKENKCIIHLTSICLFGGKHLLPELLDPQIVFKSHPIIYSIVHLLYQTKHYF